MLIQHALPLVLQVAPRAYRWAIEFRDPRCLTADWTYLRFHGGSSEGNYPRPALTAHASQIDQDLADGLDVFAYFNNDAHGYAVQNAADLRRYIRGNYRP